MESSLIGEIRTEDVEFIKFIHNIFKENDEEKINQLLNFSLELLEEVLARESSTNKRSLEWYFLDLLVETMANKYFNFNIFALLVSYDLTGKNKGKLEEIRNELNRIIRNEDIPAKEKLLSALKSNIDLLFTNTDMGEIQKKNFDLFFGTNIMTV